MPFDTTPYDTVPQTNVPGTLALIRAIITASKPVQLPASKKALKRVRAAGEDLRTLHHAAPTVKIESVGKAADAAMDRIWNAVAQRLTANVELGGDEGAEAERVNAILFPKGMAFLGFKYAEQWAEGEAALGRVAAEDLGASLDRLVGPRFVEQLRERHAAYGEALGITKAKPVPAEAASLVEPLRAARAALSTYIRTVVAGADNEDLDESVAVAALAPLAQLRQTLRGKKKTTPEPAPEPEPAPVEPLPPIE